MEGVRNGWKEEAWGGGVGVKEGKEEGTDEQESAYVFAKVCRCVVLCVRVLYHCSCFMFPEK